MFKSLHVAARAITKNTDLDLVTHVILLDPFKNNFTHGEAYELHQTGGLDYIIDDKEEKIVDYLDQVGTAIPLQIQVSLD